MGDNLQNAIFSGFAVIFRIQFAKTMARQLSAFVYGAKIFNGLDKNLGDANNKHLLKKLLKMIASSYILCLKLV